MGLERVWHVSECTGKSDAGLTLSPPLYFQYYST